MPGTRLRAAAELALVQLRYYRGRTALAVVGVAVATLATISLLALGVSVLELGAAGIESIGGDVWVTPSTLAFAPGAVGGIETTLHGTHTIASDIETRDDVAATRGIHFQTVYVGTEPGDYETLVGAGVTGDGSSFNIEAGESFSAGDVHYADGNYDGPMTEEAIIDQQTATNLGVGVGDELHVGGTIVAADEHTFEVVGISSDMRRYIGTPTVVVHLGELQQISGRTATDPGSAVLVATRDDADAATVADDLAEIYPDVTVRTTDEQFTAILRNQSEILGGAAAILVLAVVGGIALVANVFGMLVFQQRRQLATLQATGISNGLLLGAMVTQGIVVGLLGGLLGILLAIPGVEALNWVVEFAAGFEDLIMLPVWTLLSGLSLAITVGVIGAAIAGWLVLRVPTIENLSR